MIICTFENSPSIPSFLVTKIAYIEYGQLKQNDSFSFYLSIAVLLVFLYRIAAYASVRQCYLLYAGAHKISLKYLFPEKMFIEVCCQKCQKCNTICVTTYFYWISRVCKKKELNIYTRILDIMKL
jgi:hypothetical protein